MNISKIQLEESLLNLTYSFGMKKNYEVIMSTCPLPKVTEMVSLLLFDNGISEHNIYEKYLGDLKNLMDYRKQLLEKGWVDFKKQTNFEALKELTESTRHKKNLDSYFIEKFSDYSRYLTKLDGLTKEQFERFIEWEKKVEEREYQKGVLTTSNILGRMLSAIPEDNDYEPTEDDSPFFGGCQRYGDIIVKTFCGQGCYTTISFKNEIHFTTN